MSFSNCYIAAACDAETLQAAFLAAWPAFELAEPAQRFDAWNDAFEWASPRCEYLAGRHPDDVKFLYRDGAWSVLRDISLCLVEEGNLAELSRRTGRVVAATTQGTVGFAQLQLFEAGALLRSIVGEGGRRSAEGTPLAEEAGIQEASFYLDELDTLWRRLGLRSFLESEPGGPVVALHVLDRTVYPPDVAAAIAGAPVAGQPRTRPWWKIW